MLDTSARLLELLSILQTRREWSGRELAGRLEVGVRTVRRDVERLRGLGYPVEATPGPTGGYRLTAGASLPPLLVDDEEAIAIAVGLTTAARASVAGIDEAAVRVLVKLEQVLPARLRRRVGALAATTVSLPPAGPTVDAQALTVIAGACRDSERLRFAYRSREGTGSERHVEPHSQVIVGSRWYLAAWDRDRLDWRTFRVDRIADPVSTGARFTPRSLPGGDAAAYISQSMSAREHRYEARVTLRAPAEAVGERFSSRWGQLEPIDEHSCEYRSGDDDLHWLLLRILMLGVDFEIHQPEELVEHARAVAGQLSGAAASA